MSDTDRGRDGSVSGRARLVEVLPRWLQLVVAYGVVLLVCAGLGYVLIEVLARLTSVVLAVAVALLLTALLAPMVGLLHRVRVPRGLAALLTVLLLLGTVGAIVAFFGAAVARDIDDLAGNLTGGLDRVTDWLVQGPLQLSPGQLDTVRAEAASRLRAAAPGSVRGAVAVLEALAAAALAVVLLFFLLKDGPGMWRWILDGVGGRQRDRVGRAACHGWDALQAYVRGTVVIAAADAVGIGIGLVVLGVPLALPLTLLTFVASFVPLLGATVAGAVAVLVALAAKGPLTALLVLAVVLLVQNVEGNLLQPVVMSRAVRLHPAVILVVVAVGALLAGVGGALLATPVTAVAYRVVQGLRDPTWEADAGDGVSPS